MDEVRDYLRVHHYSIHTERTYCDWIKKYIRFHEMRTRDDLKDGEKKIATYLIRSHPAARSGYRCENENSYRSVR